MRNIPKPATPDYYADLGVPQHASSWDIKTAWFRLAKRFHPDKIAPGQAVDAEEFRRVSCPSPCGIPENCCGRQNPADARRFGKRITA
jgi:hypothetical protein